MPCFGKNQGEDGNESEDGRDITRFGPVMIFIPKQA